MEGEAARRRETLQNNHGEAPNRTIWTRANSDNDKLEFMIRNGPQEAQGRIASLHHQGHQAFNYY